jgi:DNA-binding IclR family transcriptional regulator
VGETSRTVDLAMAALQELHAGGPQSSSDLSRRIGASRSAVSRVLTSMELSGVVRRDGGVFTLGMGLLRFAAHIVPELREAATPILRRLANGVSATASLAVRVGDEATVIEQATPDGVGVALRYRPGAGGPLSRGALGRAMLAEVAAIHLPGVPPELVVELADIARVGYAVVPDDDVPGVTEVAAAVVDGSRHPIAAIGVIAPTPRFADPTDAAQAVVGAAADLSAAVGYIRAASP